MATKSAPNVSPKAFTALMLACVALLGYALWLQHIDNLDPCPWCIVQRLHYLTIAFVMLIGALHRPGNGGTMAYAFLGLLLALSGIAAAGYHIYLQADPKRAASCLGGWLEQWLDASRIGKIVPPLLQYDGSCTLKPWSFLTLSIPEWSLVWFVILAIVFIVMMVKSR